MNEPVSRKFYFNKDIQKGHLSTVYNYKPRNENILERKGEVFAVLQLKSDPSFDLITAGGILLDYFHETYFEIQETSTLLALEKTVIASSKHLAKLIDNDEKVGKTGIEMDILAVSIVDNVAYFVNVGDNQLRILRDEKLVNIKSALKDPSGEGMVGVASMELTTDDRLMISTEAVTESLKDKGIEDVLKKFSLDTFSKEPKKAYEMAVMIIGYKLGEVPTSITEEIDANDDKTLAEVIEEQKNEEVLVEGEFIDEVKNEDLSQVDEMIVDPELDDSQLDKEEKVIDTDTSDELIESESLSQDTPEAPKPKTYKVLLQRFGLKLKTLPKKIKSSIKKTQPELIKEDKKNNYKILLIFLAIFLLSGALYIGIRQAIKNNTEKVESEETQVSLELLTEKVSVVEGLVAEIKLNDSSEKRQQGISEVALARAELDKVKDVGSVKEQVGDFSSRIQLAEDYFNRIVTVTDDNKLIDVASFYPDAKISDIAFSSTKIYLSDSGLGKLYSVNFDGSDLKEIVSDLTNPKSLTTDTQGRVIYLDDATENRIGIYDPANESSKRLAGTSTSRIGEVSSIEFAEISGGRIYLVNTSGKKVMYMEKTGDNYGLPASRFDLAELSTGKDIFIIDNKIYILAEIKQGLYRFLNGQDDSPELIGLPEGEDMVKATGLFVDGTNIYFTDPTNNRVAVFDKGVQTAKFKGQYKFKSTDKFDELSDLVTVIAQGKIYALDGSVVYELDLAGLNEL